MDQNRFENFTVLPEAMLVIIAGGYAKSLIVVVGKILCSSVVLFD